MSPLALYIDQVSSHVPVSPADNPKVTVYPPSPQNNQIFSSFRSAPMLDKARTNRILIYPGSFNPPHRGHLHLLKHVFMRGAHDLNIIAAIIVPSSDESVGGKVRREGGHFMFGRDTRGLLWAQDLCFPPWAWVYDGTSFTAFLQRLSQATRKNGYSLEFVPLYGPQIGSPSSPPDPAFHCKTIIMSNAARAAEFQCSSGRLRNFSGCTKWSRVHVDEEELRYHAKAKAKHSLRAVKTTNPLESPSMLIDGPGWVRNTTEMIVAKALEELKSVLTCQRRMIDGRKITLRFVKCEGMSSRKKKRDISSTIVRKFVMEERGIKLREALDWTTLSADLLWQCKASWIGRARLDDYCCINLQPSAEDFLSLEEPPSDEEPPSFDDPPSLEELGLVKVIPASPSAEEPPPLEDAMSHEVTPSMKGPKTLEEPQLPEEPTNKMNKKRHFSETGLEAEIEIKGDPVSGGYLAEDQEV